MSRSSPSSDPGGTTRGASPVGDKPIGGGRWLWLALIAIAVLVIIFLLSRCGNDGDSTKPAAVTTPSVSASASPSMSMPASAPASEMATESPSPVVTGSPVDGTIFTGNTEVLGAGGVKDLNSYTGNSAVAKSVQVQSVPADEGFWVGTDPTNQVWVQLTGVAGESPYTVKKGDAVDFTGTITPVPAGFADKVGLTDAEGATQLTQQKQYLSVQKSAVKLSH